MSKYVAEFNDAFTSYSTSQIPRPGYIFGWFTSIRHSKNLYPHIATLKANLENCNDAESAKSILTQYFKSPQTKFNNHSFAIYFIEALCKKYPNEGWEQYYPKEKVVKFFNGRLYRGTLQHPNDALKNGMQGSRSDNIEDYANDTNTHTGVSTSKNLGVASKYQHSVFNTVKGCHIQKGFLYEINYRGKGGVDIIETLKARQNDITANIAAHKEEVNIIGKVDPEDIVGFWDQVGNYQKNPKYLENRDQKQDLNIFDRLQNLFRI